MCSTSSGTVSFQRPPVWMSIMVWSKSIARKLMFTEEEFKSNIDWALRKLRDDITGKQTAKTQLTID